MNPGSGFGPQVLDHGVEVTAGQPLAHDAVIQEQDVHPHAHVAKALVGVYHRTLPFRVCQHGELERLAVFLPHAVPVLVAPPGLVEQAGGLARIEGERRRQLLVPVLPGTHEPIDHGEPGPHEHRVLQVRSVDRERERPAYADIPKERVLVVPEDALECRDIIPDLAVEPESRVAGQDLHFIAAREVDRVDLAGQQLRETEGSEPDDESVDRGLAPVVVGVGLELQLSARLMAHPSVRSVAHRVIPVIPAVELGRILVLQQMLWEERVPSAGQPPGLERPHPREAHYQRRVVHHRNVFDVAQISDRRVVLEVNGKLHIVRRDRNAVMPADVGPEPDRPRASVRRMLPTLRQTALERAGIGEPGQREQ